MIVAHIPLTHPTRKGLRRAGLDPDRDNRPQRIVIHAAGEYIDTDDVDCPLADHLERIRNSVHMSVTPSGLALRHRPDDHICWHAAGHNLDTLGIEWLVPGLHTIETLIERIKTPWVTPAQMGTGLDIVSRWMTDWGITINRVVRHSDLSPGRKHDPGAGFPWDEFRDRLREATE